MKIFCRLAEWFRWCPRWGVSGAVVALILWLTLAPHPVGDADIPMFPGADKLVHGIMFGFLTFSLWFDSSRISGVWLPARPVKTLWFALGSALFGLLVEWLQMSMDMGRGFEWADAAADLAGCMATWAVIVWLKR